MEVINETIYGKTVVLLSDGTFTVDGELQEWYKDAKTQKTWIPKKRSQTIGLIKQILKD
jgi:hypothetical protein